MRNRVVVCTILAVALSAAALIAGQDPSTTPASGKVGLISMQQAILATAEGKQAMADLQKKYEPRKEQLQRDQDAINALQDQLQKGVATLSDEEKNRLSRELEEKQRLFKREQEDAQSDFQADNQDIGNRIGLKMVKIIDDYAQKNGYSLVMDLSNAQASVFYVGKGADITEPIVKLYDQANPVTAAATSSPTTSRAAKAKP